MQREHLATETLRSQIIALKAQLSSSPGQRPGSGEGVILRPVGATIKTLAWTFKVIAALTGRYVLGCCAYPGRCPGLEKRLGFQPVLFNVLFRQCFLLHSSELKRTMLKD
jgi:hypothetical protein